METEHHFHRRNYGFNKAFQNGSFVYFAWEGKNEGFWNNNIDAIWLHAERILYVVQLMGDMSRIER